MEEKEDLDQGPKSRKFLEKYGVIVSILIGCWMIAMSIIIAGLLIIRHMDANKSSDVEKVKITLNEKDVVMGNADAPVTIIEYADFQCPFCKLFQDTIFGTLKSSYIDSGQVKFVFRNFAFLGQESLDAAEAARCAQDQGKFWEYHDLLYASQGQENAGKFNLQALKGFASKLDLDQSSFNSCLDDHTHKSEIDAETEEAQGYGVQSTPTVFIDGIMYEGVMKPAEYQTAITEAVKAAEEANKGPINWVKRLLKNK